MYEDKIRTKEEQKAKEKYKRNAQMRQKEMTETHYHISKPTACFMLDLNDLKMYEDKIRTKEEQKAKEKQEKK